LGRRNPGHPMGIPLHSPILHGRNSISPHLRGISDDSGRGRRRESFEEEHNSGNLKVDLDLIHEIKEDAWVRENAAKGRTTQRYNSRVKARELRKGDLVWIKVGEERKCREEGKLTPNWDDPFWVVDTLKNRAYKLKELSGKLISRMWNNTHLKMYYS